MAIWLAAFTLGTIGMLAGLAGLLFPRLRCLPLVPRSWVCLGSLLGVLLLIELLGVMQNRLEGTPLLLARSGILLAGLGGLRAFMHPFRAGGSDPLRSPRPALTLLCVSLGFNLWLAYSVSAMPSGDVEMPPLAPADLVEVPHLVARTDTGNPIPLFANAAPNPLTPADETSLLKTMGLTQGVIRTAPPDPVYNCHGWVFTGGQYHIRGHHVAQILQENGYQETDHPEPGDVIIYRNGQGEVVHTGLVRGIGLGDFVMIESKWSVWARYLHEPATQCYSSNYTYYRSSRPGHLLAGLSGEDPRFSQGALPR